MASSRPSKIVANKDPPNATQLKYFEGNFFDPYSKIFMEGVDLNEIDNRSKNEALALFKQKRFDIFLHSINKFVSSNRFVGATLLQSILEFILTINQTYDEKSETTLRRIQSASLLFESILDDFPSAWAVCSGSYKNLLYSPVNMEIDYKKIRMNTSVGFFPIILALLEDVFEDADKNEADGNAAFDSMINFQQFERIESSKCCYTKLTRNEKIDRLFIVLNLLVKMMEIDLSIWIQRYPFQTKSIMSNHNNTCPLIAHLLWKGKQSGELSMMMRDVLRLFTMCIWIDFPDNNTDILARLVHLISVAVNLSEHCDSDNLISYPNIKRLTKAFGAEMIKRIESFPYTVDFYLKMISKIRSPVIGMLVTVRILSKFSREFENISLRTVVDAISSGSYKQYDEKLNDAPSREGHSGDNYPVYDPRKDEKNSKHLQCSRDEYLTLLLHLFKSYVEVYRTHDLLRSLLANDQAQPSSSSADQEYQILHEKVENERNRRMDFDKMFMYWEQLTPAAKELAATDTIPVVPTVDCQNVYLDPSELIRYQEDLEYLVILKKIVNESEQLGDAFSKWRTAVATYLAT